MGQGRRDDGGRARRPTARASGYALCIYGDTDATADAPHRAARARPAAPVKGKPCWKALGKPKGTTGYKYNDPDLTPHGIQSINAKPGVDGKAQLIVKGKGATLRKPALPIAAFPLRVQLQKAGTCFEVKYEAADVTKNEAGLLKLKGPHSGERRRVSDRRGLPATRGHRRLRSERDVHGDGPVHRP